MFTRSRVTATASARTVGPAVTRVRAAEPAGAEHDDLGERRLALRGRTR